MFRIILLPCLAAMLTFACVDSKFRRQNTGKRSTNNTSSNNPNNPNNLNNPNNPNNPHNPNNPNSLIPPFDPDNLSSADEEGKITPWQRLIEPGIDPNNNPFFRTFGGLGKLWHIGDSGWKDTSCKTKMFFRFIVRAREFNFNFEVLDSNGDTTVNASIKFCGTDYQGSQVQIINAANQQAMGPSTQLSLTGPYASYTYVSLPTVKLPKGFYKVRVTSMQQGTDLDNYLVGRVNLDPDKAIRLGQVTSN